MFTFLRAGGVNNSPITPAPSKPPQSMPLIEPVAMTEMKQIRKERKIPRRSMSHYRQLSASAWCKKSTSSINMIPELAEAFAKILKKEGERYPCKPEIFEKTYEKVVLKKFKNKKRSRGILTLNQAWVAFLKLEMRLQGKGIGKISQAERDTEKRCLKVILPSLSEDEQNEMVRPLGFGSIEELKSFHKLTG